MRKLTRRLIISLSLMGCALATALAQQPAGRCHVLLFDVSGSMRADNRYQNNLKGWLVEPLVKSGAFAQGDRVVVRWFDKRGNTSFSKSDGQRRYDGKYDLQAILDNVPLPQEATGLNTDLPEALGLALADIKELPIQGDVLIWMITDNDQDAEGMRDVDRLYEKISDDKDFRAAYLFPLSRENGQSLQNKSAMVLYLLYYSQKGSPPNLDPIADDVGQKIKNPPITWFPFEKGILVDETSITANSEPVSVIDNRLSLPDVPEGVPPEFELQFRFKSQLRGREITKGKITRPAVSINQLPESLEQGEDLKSWRADISPSMLAMKTGQSSSSVYKVTIASQAAGLRPSSFWDGMWNPISEPVGIMLQFTPEVLESKLDVPAISAVKNLDGIRQIVTRSQKSARPVVIPMSFRVAHDTLWRRAVAASLAVAMVAMLGGAAAVFLVKNRYELSTPNGEQLLTLPVIGSNYITLGNGERAAIIRKRFGSLKVEPLKDYLVDGAHIARALASGTSSFEIQSESDGRKYPHSIKRLAAPSSPTVVQDDLLD
jgi:hypothetical protein